MYNIMGQNVPDVGDTNPYTGKPITPEEYLRMSQAMPSFQQPQPATIPGKSGAGVANTDALIQSLTPAEPIRQSGPASFTNIPAAGAQPSDQPTSQIGSQARLNAYTREAAVLKASGIPEEAIKTRLNTRYPEFSPESIKANTPIGKDSPLYYNEFGEALPHGGVSQSQAEDQGFTKRTTPQVAQITAARGVYSMLDEIDKLAPQVLKSIEKYRGKTGLVDTIGNKIGAISDIKLNEAALAAARAAGDPIVRQWDAMLIPATIRFGIAMGVPGGRETLGMVTRMATELPGQKDSQESAKSITDTARRNLEAASGVKAKPRAEASGSATSKDMVAVISPDGKKGKIPAANLQKALKQGYKQVQ